MKQLKYFVAALAVAITAGALAQQSGGFPSLPTFQGVQAIGKKNCGSDTASICATSTAVSHDRWSIALRPQGGAGNILGELITCSGNSTDTCLRVDTAAGTSFKIDGAGGVSSLGADLTAQDSGALTWSFTTAQNPNCSAGGTNATVQLRKRGPLVTMSITSFGTCTTAGATNFTTNNTPVPAAFRPATSAGGCGVIEGGNAAGNAIVAVCVNTAGNFIVSNPAGSTTLIQIAGQMSTTYSLD